MENPIANSWNALNESVKEFRNGFNGLDSFVGGQRETVTQNAPPLNQQQGGQPPPQGYQNNPGTWGNNFANPYYGGYPQQHQGPYYPQMQSPFVAPRIDIPNSMLEYHAKLRVKLLKIKNKMRFTIPKQLLKSYFDRKEDRKLIAEFFKAGTKKSEIEIDSPIFKAFERQDKVEQLDTIADENSLQEMDEFMEFISIEEFKLARENGTLRLPTLEEFNSSVQQIMLIDFADFIIYGIKEATGSIGVNAKEWIETIKNQFSGG
jgi:hypothetical protein